MQATQAITSTHATHTVQSRSSPLMDKLYELTVADAMRMQDLLREITLLTQDSLSELTGEELLATFACLHILSQKSDMISESREAIFFLCSIAVSFFQEENQVDFTTLYGSVAWVHTLESMIKQGKPIGTIRAHLQLMLERFHTQNEASAPTSIQEADGESIHPRHMRDHMGQITRLQDWYALVYWARKLLPRNTLSSVGTHFSQWIASQVSPDQGIPPALLGLSVLHVRTQNFIPFCEATPTTWLESPDGRECIPPIFTHLNNPPIALSFLRVLYSRRQEASWLLEMDDFALERLTSLVGEKGTSLTFFCDLLPKICENRHTSRDLKINLIKSILIYFEKEIYESNHIITFLNSLYLLIDDERESLRDLLELLCTRNWQFTKSKEIFCAATTPRGNGNEEAFVKLLETPDQIILLGQRLQQALSLPEGELIEAFKVKCIEALTREVECLYLEGRTRNLSAKKSGKGSPRQQIISLNESAIEEIIKRITIEDLQFYCYLIQVKVRATLGNIVDCVDLMYFFHNFLTLCEHEFVVPPYLAPMDALLGAICQHPWTFSEASVDNMDTLLNLLPDPVFPQHLANFTRIYEERCVHALRREQVRLTEQFGLIRKDAEKNDEATKIQKILFWMSQKSQ